MEAAADAKSDGRPQEAEDALLTGPKRSSSHPVSRITVILSVGNGPASRALLAAKPGWVSLFSHVLPKKTCPALGLLWARLLQGWWAVREAGVHSDISVATQKQ